MDPEAERTKLLLAEKTYIEQRISSNLDLQQKVMAGGLTAVFTALGWALSSPADTPKSLSMILFSIVSISALSGLMAVIYGGFALAAIVFKEEVLGVEFETLLATKTRVFGSLKTSQDGAAGRLISLATSLLYVGHIGLGVTVYVSALLVADWGSANHPMWSSIAGAIVAGGFLAASIVSVLAFVRTVRQVNRG